MHIALLSAEYPPAPGGIGDYTQRLAAALAAAGQRVTILTAGLAPADEPPDVLRLPIRRWDWGLWPAAIAALAALRPDVLHVEYQTGAFGMHPAVNFLPWRLRRLPQRPRVVATAHDLLPPYLFPKAGPLRWWVTRRLLADADAAVVTNEEDRARLARAGLRGVELIPIGSNIPVAPPPGYDREAWRASLGVDPGVTLLAYFGLISASKGLDVLARALARLPASYHLLVIGGAATAPQDVAYAERVRRQIAASLAARVTFTGQCDAAAVSGHLLAADLAALPFADGASLRRGSLLAALAHGLPTVTTLPQAAPGPRGAEPGAFAGGSKLPALGVPPGDDAALAAAIERVAHDAALRGQLAAEGRALAARLSWESIAAQHVALYDPLVAPAAAAR